MLHYLPIPRPDELLYSVFARYAVHMGIISPKQCLDDLFGCRTVVATVDLPSHLDAFLANAGRLWDISPEDLIYRHTLFPLYALFVPERRRHAAVAHMRSNDGGSLHVQLGVAASTVRPPNHLRFCPACLQDQQRCYGEYFWRRSWQVAGAETCRLHGLLLLDSNVRFRHLERHRFVTATPSTCITRSADNQDTGASETVRAFGDLIVQLLEIPPLPSPTFHQWSQFYHEVAADLGCANGAHIRHQDLLDKFRQVWSDSGNGTVHRAPGWLTGLFRKHRKSFSYSQHLVAWVAFLPGQTVTDIARRVSSLPRRKNVPAGQVHSSPDAGDLTKYRSQWRLALDCFGHRGTKWIRANISYMAASYAWLYRHDRPWLLGMNAKHRVKHRAMSGRVNWSERDQALCRKLRRIADNRDSISARRTKAWYISHLPHHAAVEKNLRNLPLCAAFLGEISESVADYQIRRCKYALQDLKSEGLPLVRWRVERRARVSVRSMRPATDRFLASLDGAVCDESDNPEYPQ